MTLNQDRRRIAFIKAMVAAAWADGELNSGEIEKLTEYLQRFEITAVEYDEIKPLLEQPLEPDEADALLDAQLVELSSREERGALLAAVKDLLLANAELTVDESRFLERLEDLVDGVSTPQLFVSRLRALWSISPRRRAEAANSEPRQADSARRFMQRRLLEYFRRRIVMARAMAGQSIDEGISDDDLYRVVIWAGLLARVAAADDNFCPREEEELVRLLSLPEDIPEPDVRVVVEAYRDSGLAKIDLNLLVRELINVSSTERASRLLDCLFLVAAADDELVISELKLIRAISTRLGFPETAYRDALERCKRRMATGWN
ncbi:MAG: TerB family tellurite resistance protein [Myxococcales bacterium]|nr:TerB family tellurite resistance protein [Myxococcales bacterium]